MFATFLARILAQESAMFMTLAQAAESLGLSVDTIRHQRAAGRIRAEKFGRDWLVTDAEVERYRRESLGQVGRPRVTRPFSEIKKARLDKRKADAAE